MTDNYRTNYSYSEEAFLLSSLQEVAKVWARGTGQASFHLNILDGMAQLELSFKLGGPGDLHCDPVHALVPPPPFPPYHEDQRPRRRKGPGRLERDRLRAEKHRAKVSKHERAEAAVSAVKLPFSGKILPVKSTKPPANRNLYPEDVPLAAAPAVGHRQAVPAVTSPPASVEQPPAKPRKSLATPTPTPQRYIDASVAKKQLFAPPQRPTSSSIQPTAKKKYEMKEDDLWTKLFH